MYQNLHFYIDLDWEGYVQQGADYLKQLYRIVCLAYQHQAKVLYSRDQVEEFTSQCEDLDENFTQSNGNLLGLILENAIGSKRRGYAFEMSFQEEHTSLKHLNHAAINSMTTDGLTPALLSLSSVQGKYTVLFVESDEQYERHVISVCGDHRGTVGWMIGQTRDRVFNPSLKHGTDSRKAWASNKGDGISQLRCTPEEAQVMLKLAIPDLNKYKNKLFYFDGDRGAYLEFWFEGDNPQNLWHGYHLNEAEWPSRIPNSIRRYFKQ